MADRAWVDIVVPVHNEESVLARSIRRLHVYLSEEFPFDWRIVIADNASTDGTRRLAHRLAGEMAGVKVLEIEQKGRGRALRTAWMDSDADVVAYTDVDLSTGLTGILPLVAPLVSGHADVSVGSRLSEGSVVARGPKRELISRMYNLILRLVFAVRFRDAQCGFKAVRTEVAHRLVPAVEDQAWFFDTELLLLAEHNGLRVHEVAVDWVDDPDSRVNVSSTAIDDLRGVCRVLWTFMRGGGNVDLGPLERKPLVDDFGRQTVSFVLIGLLSGIISLGLFFALRDQLGPIWANIIAFTATTVGNNWAHRRWTFRRRGAEGRWWHIATSTIVFLITVTLSSIGLAAVQGNSSAEVAVLLVTWGLAGLVRFIVFRSWVYRQAPVEYV
jgi:glycosyltransferase involved in cell wall biosynthesis